MLSFLSAGKRARAAAGPPSVDAPAFVAPLPGGAFGIEFKNVDARALGQIKSYASFVQHHYPGWLTRFQIAADDTPTLTLHLFVFPKRMAYHFYTSPPQQIHGRR